MKLKNLRKRKLTESAGLDFMSLMQKAIRRHRLNESCEDEEGLDEFADDETEDFGDEDMDVDAELADDELAGDEDMVTIRVPRSVAEELGVAVEEATDEEIGDEDIEITDEDVAEADANIEAEDAADAAFGEEDEEGEEEEETEVEVDVTVDGEPEEECTYEEDEEAFVATKTTAPTRQRFTGSYKNEPTVASIIKGAIAKSADYKTVTDGSPKRTQLTQTYNNSGTVKSRYQTGTRWLQNT